MAGYRFLLIPADPAFVPPEEGRREARKLVREALTRAEEVTDRVGEEVQLFSSGEPGRIGCPSCGGELEPPFWEDAVALAGQKLFRNLRATLPCCGVVLSLNDLQYARPTGFARYSLEISNPNVSELPAQLIRAVGRALGCPVRSVWKRE